MARAANTYRAARRNYVRAHVHLMPSDWSFAAFWRKFGDVLGGEMKKHVLGIKRKVHRAKKYDYRGTTNYKGELRR